MKKDDVLYQALSCFTGENGEKFKDNLSARGMQREYLQAIIDFITVHIVNTIQDDQSNT